MRIGHYLKRWADRYPFVGEVKESSFHMEPGRWNLVVSSNCSIAQCFNETDGEAIARRFAQIEITRENNTPMDIRQLTPP
jgi:hypothetical protein